MKIAILGATGDLGRECLKQSVEVGHEVTVLVRRSEKIPETFRDKISIIQGDGLSSADVHSALHAGTDAILFAIGVDEKTSPQNLCTDVTRNVIDAMRKNDIPRLVWCGGGSNLREEDVVTFGAKFVRWFAEVFLNHRHTDKEHQFALLDENMDLNWIGIRPLQMTQGPKKGAYRLGYDAFNAMSKIHFADCAHAMVAMLEDDTWTRQAPIIQY